MKDKLELLYLLSSSLGNFLISWKNSEDSSDNVCNFTINKAKRTQRWLEVAQVLRDDL